VLVQGCPDLGRFCARALQKSAQRIGKRKARLLARRIENIPT